MELTSQFLGKCKLIFPLQNLFPNYEEGVQLNYFEIYPYHPRIGFLAGFMLLVNIKASVVA